jgi:uncharacterized surface protein with fasciclin (FAS1) repeats
MLTKIWNPTPRAPLALAAILSLSTAVAAQTTPAQNPRPSEPAQTERDKAGQQTTTSQPQPTSATEQQPAATAQPATPTDASATATTAEMTATVTILETIAKTGMHTTLAKAIEAAGLTEMLKGAGPYTIFAPTDEAFAKLPAGALEDLLRPENKEKLKGILSYHVVSGNVMAADVAKMNGKSAQTAQGGELSVSTAAEGVKVGNAMVKQADVVASNGTIHVIDTVLMPGDAKTGGAKKKPTQ